MQKSFILEFKGDSTIKKIGTIQLNDLKDTARCIPHGNKVALRELRLQVLEVLAIIENKLAKELI